MLYLDCANGISGDMSVAALLGLGADQKGLEKMIDSLHLSGFHCHFGKKNTYGIEANDFDVHLEDDVQHQHEHSHEGHHHAEHHCHGHSHVHRNLYDIIEIIDKAELSESARILAKKIFQIVAEAEAKVHGKPLREVHFHEVGAIDSIIDILSVAYCIDNLGIKDVAVSVLTEGQGFVECQHGALAVPVPAVSEIAARYKIPLHISEVRGEMVTPTGIAVAAALRNCDCPSEFIIKKISYGSGKRDFGRANVLKAMIIEPLNESKEGDEVTVLECNIDDASGECLAEALDELMKHGAKDVSYTPCFMKKNRPAWILRVITDKELCGEMEKIIFQTTTTIGIRKSRMQRSCMARSLKTVKLPFGEVTVKECRWGEIVKIYPEYESVKALAEKVGMTFSEVYSLASKGA